MFPFGLMLLLLTAGCEPSDEPFYMRDLASLRRLPEEDLLRMRDDILTQSAKLPDQRVEDNAPRAKLTARGRLLAVGERKVSGTVQVRERPNGKRVICLEDFRVPRAPDSRVEYAEAAGEFRDLGPLFGNVGRQCFELPGGKSAARIRIRSVIFDETLAEAALSSAP